MNTQTVPNPQEGIRLANKFLIKTLDKRTVLFLSGGKTPEPLYRKFAREKKFVVGAVGMIDERFTERGHTESNEAMIEKTGLLSYLSKKNIPFYPMLRKGLPFEKCAHTYDVTVRFLLNHFSKSVGVMGIGEYGHTAGILPNAKEEPRKLVSAVLDPNGVYPQRITMTFSALTLIDILVVLAFGENKRKVLADMRINGSIAALPARFYSQKGIVKKTILITDQTI